MNKRTLILIAAVAVVPFLLVPLPYYLSFRAADFGSDRTFWGLFGDYVGGTLGAIYGLLAFLGVLYLVYAQRQQEAANQLLSLMSSTAVTIDKLLHSRPSHPLALHHAYARQQEGRQFTVDWILGAAAGRRLQGRDEIADAAGDDARMQEIDSIRHELNLINAELLHFTHCLIEFRKAGGSAEVEAVYRSRFLPLAAKLAEVGILNNVSSAHFDVEALRGQPEQPALEQQGAKVGQR
jgi:hypothetical protein